MPTPNADGPDIARRYQAITGPPDPSWRLYTVKWCEGQRSEHASGRWREQWTQLRAWQAQGLLRWIGGYHWLRSDSTPRAQAEFALRLIEEQGGLRTGEIWQIDWEVTEGIPLMTSDAVIEYQEILRAEIGERDITYSSDWIGDSTLDPDSRNEFFEWREAMPDAVYWHANYNTGTRPQDGWAEIQRYDADVWQWTSRYRHASIDDGIDGFDMNHIRKTEGLDRIAGLRTERPPIEPPPPPLRPLGEVNMPSSIVTPVAGPERIMPAGRPGSGVRHLMPVQEGTPKESTSVEVMITAVEASAPGHVTVWPGEGDAPLSSVVNFTPGVPANGTVTVGLITAPNGLRAFAFEITGGPVTLTMDQSAYYIETRSAPSEHTHPEYAPKKHKHPLQPHVHETGQPKS